MRILLLFLVLFLSSGCKQNGEVDLLDKVKYTGDTERSEAIEYINKILKEKGDLGVYGDLSPGLEGLIKDSNINLVERETHYQLELSPVSNEGHDFSLKIDKEKPVIYDVVVGEIEPDPEEEE